ncbi:DUF6630 family protein [Hymenobacter agri]
MNQENLSRFVQLFTLNDADATQRVRERLALVLTDAAGYQEQFAEELAERDIVTELPTQELRDVALIDALLDAELIWECDWQDTAAWLIVGINEVLMQQRRTRWPNEPARPSVIGPEALDIVQDLLEPCGLALVLFTLDADAYALSVVADAQAEEARQLAKELGFGITVY